MLKSFDFFRKIQTQQQLTSSTGGFFTIIAFIAAGLLMFLSIQDYYHQSYHTFLAVKNDDSQYLPMRIDITFNKMPCQVLQIQFHDEMQYVQTGLQNKLKMFAIINNQQILYERGKSRDTQFFDLKKAVQQGHQCRIVGIISLPKTPGTITIEPTAQNSLIQNLDGPVHQKLRMSYKMSQLQFGLGNNTFDFPIAHKSKIVQEYIRQLQGNYLSRTFVQDFSNVQNKNDFYNHVKIIPVVFDQISSYVQVGQKYRYSLRAGEAPTYEPFQKLMFSTQIQPINIVYKRSQASLYDLIVSLLAIVGGTVATIGIVNSISHFLFKII